MAADTRMSRQRIPRGLLSYRVRVTSPTACPSCGAALRPGQLWCTLCYADLRPPEPEPTPEVAADPVAVVPPDIVAAAPDPLDLSTPLDLVGRAAVPADLTPAIGAAPAAGPTWPCTTCGAANSFDRDLCGSCGSAFLAAARDDGPLLELPVVGDLTRLSRAQRLGLAAGLVVAFLAVVLIVGLLFG